MRKPIFSPGRIFALLLLLSWLPALGQKGGTSQSPIFPIDIPAGSIIEGSVQWGGLQPDYLIDIDHPAFIPLLKTARVIGKSDLGLWEKINRINLAIRLETLPKRKYDDFAYRDLLAQYRNLGKQIPLSEYVCVGAGVCRENALILHYALKAAGITNQYVYAQITTQIGNNSSSEDHAFVVVDFEGKKWIADSYDAWFNGYPLDQFMTAEGVGPETKGSSIAMKVEARRWINKFNDYPRILKPVEKSCRQALSSP